MTKKIKNVPIRYTSRDFESIKSDLVEHARRYYPNSFKDFNEASFGSLMLDTVAYVGDILSFYLDYQANESFLETATEYNNVLKLAKQTGYKHNPSPSSFGTATFYIVAPTGVTGQSPDTDYLPTLRRGSAFSTTSGNRFLLTEDVDFSNSNNEIVVAAQDSSGVPTYYAVRAYGQVMSGEILTTQPTVGAFERFLKVPLPGNNVAEVISVFDSEGHEYFEVEYLSQNTVYQPVLNRKKTTSLEPRSLLKATTVPRRFVVERNGPETFLQFGYGSETEIESESIENPQTVIMKKHGKSYTPEVSLDPSKLVQSDKFGISPANTTLTITMRTNTRNNVNASAGSLVEVVSPIFLFPDDATNGQKTADVIDSLEVMNAEPIVGDVSFPTLDELKHRVAGTFSTQNRAVTSQDYKMLAYALPAQFGAIKRCAIVQDHDALRRNLNMYITSEDSFGNLTSAHTTIKSNLATWLNGYRMINDSIDILDAKIVNLGIEFTAMADVGYTKQHVLSQIMLVLDEHFAKKAEIGEAFSITEIYRIINGVEGVTDTTFVNVNNKTGGSYSDVAYDIREQTSPDGRYIYASEDIIFEILNPLEDIKGVIK